LLKRASKQKIIFKVKATENSPQNAKQPTTHEFAFGLITQAQCNLTLAKSQRFQIAHKPKSEKTRAAEK
jgi:hypothetical protein